MLGERTRQEQGTNFGGYLCERKIDAGKLLQQPLKGSLVTAVQYSSNNNLLIRKVHTAHVIISYPLRHTANWVAGQKDSHKVASFAGSSHEVEHGHLAW